MNLKIEEKISQDSPSMCVLKNPFSAQQGDGVALHCSPCINFDAVFDAMREYPAYKSYFSEKLAKVANLESRILNRELRAKGETKAFLEEWRNHFIQQIEFTINYLGRD